MADDVTQYNLGLAIDAGKSIDGAGQFVAAVEKIVKSAEDTAGGIKGLDAALLAMSVGLEKVSKSVTEGFEKIIGSAKSMHLSAKETSTVFGIALDDITDKAFKMEDSVSRSLKATKVSLEDLKRGASDPFGLTEGGGGLAAADVAGTASKITAATSEAARGGNDMKDAFKGTAAGLREFSFHGDAAYSVIRKVNAAQTLLNLALQGSPWGLIAAGVAGAVAIYSHFSNTTEKAHKVVHDLNDELKTQYEAFSKLTARSELAGRGVFAGAAPPDDVAERLRVLDEAAVRIQQDFDKIGEKGFKSVDVSRKEIDKLVQGYAGLTGELESYYQIASTYDTGTALVLIGNAALKARARLDERDAHDAAQKDLDDERKKAKETSDSYEKLMQTIKDLSLTQEQIASRKVFDQAFKIGLDRGDDDPSGFAHATEQAYQAAAAEHASMEKRKKDRQDFISIVLEEFDREFRLEHEWIEMQRRDQDESDAAKDKGLQRWQKINEERFEIEDKRAKQEAADFEREVNQTEQLTAAMISKAFREDAAMNAQEARVKRMIRALEEETAMVNEDAYAHERAAAIRQIDAETIKLSADRVAELKAAYLKAFDAAEAARRSKALADAISTPITNGLEELLLRTRSLADTLKQVFLEIEKAAIHTFITAPLQQGLSGVLGGLLGGAAGAGSSSGGGALGLGGGGFGLAHGGAISSGHIVRYKSGGVTNGPEYFPLADGRMGLRGESGDEGVLPLARTSSGDLGVKTTGGAGSKILHMNIYTQDASSFGRSQRQITSDARRFFGS